MCWQIPCPDQALPPNPSLCVRKTSLKPDMCDRRRINARTASHSSSKRSKPWNRVSGRDRDRNLPADFDLDGLRPPGWGLPAMRFQGCCRSARPGSLQPNRWCDPPLRSAPTNPSPWSRLIRPLRNRHVVEASVLACIDGCQPLETGAGLL